MCGKFQLDTTISYACYFHNKKLQFVFHRPRIRVLQSWEITVKLELECWSSIFLYPLYFHNIFWALRKRNLVRRWLMALGWSENGVFEVYEWIDWSKKIKIEFFSISFAFFDVSKLVSLKINIIFKLANVNIY